MIKATSIDPAVVDADGVYRKTGPARVFTHRARSDRGDQRPGPANQCKPGDVVVLIGRGPLGSGMEETYQLTSALKYLTWGRDVAVVTDARFSGVSTGACIGHVGPEALAGGPLSRLRDGDLICIEIDRHRLEGRVDMVGQAGQLVTSAQGAAILAGRTAHPALAADRELPDDTRLWAALQQLSGGTWGGCVYDVEAILAALQRGMAHE